MKYYIIAGEASGDLHASFLMKELKNLDTQAEFRYWGGDLMQAVSPGLQKHYRKLAFMGFWEVIKNIRTISANFKESKAAILDFQPDALILVDYPGFNLRIAKWAKQQNIKIYYYISPQIWAWKSNRVHQIKANVDEMFVILPFEEAFYAKYDMKVNYVGHPLLDVIKEGGNKTDFRAKNDLQGKRIIALLPGSRKQEIDRMLGLMLATAKYFQDHQFVIAGAPGQETSYYESLFEKYGQLPNVCLLEGQTYDLLRESEAALVTSGTATLETALFKVPQIVCYTGSPISYPIAKYLIKVKYISLVNLIMDQPLVLELIQHDLTVKRLSKELEFLLSDSEKKRIHKGYLELEKLLGSGGAAARCAAGIRNHQFQLVDSQKD